MFFILMIVFFGFFLFFLSELVNANNDTLLLVEQVPCEKLIEIDLYLQHWKSLDYVKEECF